MDTSWVKNSTKVPQSWGPITIEPNAVGLVPTHVADYYRQIKSKEILVIEDHPELWVFKRTEHEPWSPRYQK